MARCHPDQICQGFANRQRQAVANLLKTPPGVATDIPKHDFRPPKSVLDGPLPLRSQLSRHQCECFGVSLLELLLPLHFCRPKRPNEVSSALAKGLLLLWLLLRLLLLLLLLLFQTFPIGAGMSAKHPKQSCEGPKLRFGSAKFCYWC